MAHMISHRLQAAQLACDTADKATISDFCKDQGNLPPGALDVAFHDGPMAWGFELFTPARGKAVMTLGRQFDGWEKNVVVHRMGQTLPLVKQIIETGTLPRPMHFAMGDGGRRHEVAFCSSEGSTLIPDCDFMHTGGWQEQRAAFEHQTAWVDRSDIPFWRGSSSGHRDGPTFLDLPRVRLCTMARQAGYDMAITTPLIQGYGQDDMLFSSGLLGESKPWQVHGGNRFNIDIDGNSASWQGLFMKLLAGGVVLKVNSAHGFRQWYYDRLESWINFIPVRSDLSDLVEIVDCLRRNDELAQEIARNGRSLALAMTVEREVGYRCAQAHRVLVAGGSVYTGGACQLLPA